MLLALISDIHANDLAFEACLETAARLRAERIVLLGDLVGYGPAPEAVVARAARLSGKGAVSLRGNHDWAVGQGDRSMNAVAAAAIAWTRQKLSSEASRYLANLPMAYEENGLLFVHADASAPASWNYVTDATAARKSMVSTPARITFCGHVHMPQVYCLTATGKLVGHRPVTDVPIPLSEQRQWLAVIGSAGQPRDGNPAASFATYDTVRREITYRRVPYDVDAIAARIRAEGLPDSLAARLLTGH